MHGLLTILIIAAIIFGAWVDLSKSALPTDADWDAFLAELGS